MQSPNKPETTNQGRETIFDSTNANTSVDVPSIIKQINELVKQDEENHIVVVWESKDDGIGITSNRNDILGIGKMLAKAMRRLKSQIYAILEC